MTPDPEMLHDARGGNDSRPYRRNASGSPPSTGMTWPVVFALASPASQQIAFAQSIGRIGRRVIVRAA